jgi:hypothetical protein
VSDFPAITPRPADDPDQPGLRTRLEGFQISEEVEAVALVLIDRHSRLAYLGGHELAYILDHGEPPADATTDTAAKVHRVTGWRRALTPAEAALVVNAVVWSLLGARAREALVMHHLLHLDTNEKTGELVTVGHDVEEFHLVAATYGAWQPGLRTFGEQLGLGLEAGAS